MQSLAQAIQSQGRGNDTMLVHMTPNEVGGLQTLANNFGGSLTTNPSTGLPEAGFLDSILPMVAGFALAPVMGPAAAALAVGGGTTVLTGDIQKGLSAGLGAYGGASLAGAGGVPGPGEQIAAPAATPPPTTSIGATTPTGISSVNPLTTGTAASDAAKLAADNYQGAAQVVTPDLAQANQVTTLMGTGTPPASFNPYAGQGAITQQANLAQEATGRNFVGSGLQGQMIDPTYSQALQNFSFEQLSQAPKGELIKAGLASVSPYAFQEPDFNVRQTPATIRPFRFDANPTGAERGGTPTYAEGQRRYFNPKFTALPPYRLNRRDGGIVNLNTGGSPSRFLRGAGDGVSDSIPATVNQGERPAALSDGEYVIDARGVAEIGNGSSEAGARKLTEMMNRIHAARRKADKGEDMNADRFLLT
tara:strand:+ start:29 stop:1285 length:1257 start_codon:yes stop_codon:yes gene_type:complete